MKLMGKCQRCDRELLLEQLRVPGAPRCPWCGTGLAQHYATLLFRLTGEAERAGRELTRNLTLLAGDWSGFDLDERSVLGPIERALGVAAERDSANLSRPRPKLHNYRHAA